MNTQTTLNDIFNKTAISLQSNLYKYSILDILINLSASFLAGLFIYYIYKKTFSGVLYQKSFNVSLIAITMIVTLMIMTISGNLVLSLGLVGALSIVRFRTPIKDPIDLVFIFWAITVGIANGVGYFNITLIGSLFITIILFILSKEGTNLNSYLLILQLPTSTNTKEIENIIKSNTTRFNLKSKTITKEYKELIYEITIKNDNDLYRFIENIKNNNTLSKITLLTYSGELKYT